MPGPLTTPQRRPRRTVLRTTAGLGALALLLAGLTWWAARPDVAWSTVLPGDGWRVLDADADRVLLEGPDQVALLRRDDGDVLRLLRAPAGQGWLVPGGGFLTVSQDEDLLQAWDEVASDQDDAGPTPLWERRGQTVRLHGATPEVVAVSGLVSGPASGPGPDRLLGLDPRTGSEVWSVEADDVLTGVSSGWVQDDLDVVAATVRGRREGVLVSVADGGVVAELPIGRADVRRPAPGSLSVVVWEERALVVTDDRAWVVSPEGAVPVDLPPGLVPANQAGGVVTVSNRDTAVGVDLESASVSPLPDDASTFVWTTAFRSTQVDDRTTVVPLAGRLTGVDRATGEVLFTLAGDGTTLAQGRDAALVVGEPSGWDAWLEVLAGLRHDRSGELQVVDRDGDLHGSVLTDTDHVGDRAVLEGHEAVVVLRGSDDDESRIVLLGR